MTELGGHRHQDRQLMHEPTAGSRRSEQRPSTQDTASSSAHQTEGRGSDQSANEDTANEDDEEDSSTSKDDEQEDETNEPEVPAPSYGFGKGGKGKGKRPSIRIEPVDDDESHNEDDETSIHGTGRTLGKNPVNQLQTNMKKRTFSNLSSTSVLFGDDSTDQDSFPRRKMARKLSNMASKPLLRYQESDNHTHVERYENVIESDDDEDYSGVNLVPEDDDDDLDMQEESFILQEEQQATTLLNEFRDARRHSLDSCASDDIFGVTVPLDEAFMSSLPDFGFAQFFEPDALPSSPDPAAKRKYSDSSTKRVRFDDEVQVSDDSSSESSELDSSVFPDLFLEQDKLPPVLHQLLEMENDDDNGDMDSPVSDASFWDFGQDESRITQAHDSDETDDNSSDGSSGYDCTIISDARFISMTNTVFQLTWVIPLTKKISDPMFLREHLSRSSPYYADLLRRQDPGQQPQPHSSAAQGQGVIKSRPLAVSLSTMIAPKLLPSPTALPRPLPSTVLARP